MVESFSGDEISRFPAFQARAGGGEWLVVSVPGARTSLVTFHALFFGSVDSELVTFKIYESLTAGGVP